MILIGTFTQREAQQIAKRESLQPRDWGPLTTSNLQGRGSDTRLWLATCWFDEGITRLKPLVDANGEPVTDIEGRPRMEPVKVYPVTEAMRVLWEIYGIEPQRVLCA